MNDGHRNLSRRNFIGTSAAAAAGSLLIPSLASAAFLQDKQELKIALVGCGGRGSGAIEDAIKAGEFNGVSVKVVAVADWFKNKADDLGRKHGVDPEMCFGGAEGYKQVMASDADIILLAAAPVFRPIHFRAAIEAGKHVFMEKPVAVDAPGCRHIIETGEMATGKKLCVVAGTQRRHETSYLGQSKLLEAGDLGTVQGGTVSWCQGQLWYKTREEGESDADYLVRNWVNWMEMNGEMIAEQHVHNIDVALWYIGRPPRSAMGFGARHRRVTGNQYDMLSTDFDFGEGVHIHSMCRQIDGCANDVGEFLHTEKANIWGGRRMMTIGGQTIDPASLSSDRLDQPYVQEHVDLQRAIMTGEYINEAEQVTNSCVAAIMGRIAAYTGQRVLWDEMMTDSNSKWYSLALAPSALDFETGSISLPEENVAPVPGT